jgi:hypothetical protein
VRAYPPAWGWPPPPPDRDLRRRVNDLGRRAWPVRPLALCASPRRSARRTTGTLLARADTCAGRISTLREGRPRVARCRSLTPENPHGRARPGSQTPLPRVARRSGAACRLAGHLVLGASPARRSWPGPKPAVARGTRTSAVTTSGACAAASAGVGGAPSSCLGFAMRSAKANVAPIAVAFPRRRSPPRLREAPPRGRAEIPRRPNVRADAVPAVSSDTVGTSLSLG